MWGIKKLKQSWLNLLALKFITNQLLFMNWGYKILFVYAAFVLGMLFLVFKSSSQKMDLVTSDYYAKELKYQGRIDETARANNLSEAIRYKIKDSKLIINFPKDFSGKKLTGEAVLYCPSDEGKDSRQHFSVQDVAVIIPLDMVNKGLYQLQLSWQADGVAYYFENKIVL
jgi:hypothetical protein